MAEWPLPPSSTIGILGGGQLGRMLAAAASRLGLKVHIFCPEANAPAFDVAARATIASYSDLSAISEFAEAVDVVTFEFENIPAAALQHIENIRRVLPSARSLAVSQDRLSEKKLFDHLSLPVAPFAEVASIETLELAVANIGRPAILKTRRLGYDGKGQVKIEDATDLAHAFAAIGSATAVLEAFVPFTSEISILTVRSADGENRAYDPVENAHENQMLAESRVPARIPVSIAESATEIARKIVTELDHVGMLAVEMFYCMDDTENPLLINEIAPRVHNSGHWTLDACLVSQFENHIRAVAGWPLGSVRRHCDCVMVNLTGEDANRWPQLAADDSMALHLYGKEEPRKRRKMGHFTRLSRKT